MITVLGNDSILTQHTFTDGAETLDRSLRSFISHVSLKLDAYAPKRFEGEMQQ